MWVVFKTMLDRDRAYLIIKENLKLSRFTADMDDALCLRMRRLPAIKINYIRLRGSKEYCGQHPCECQVNPYFKQKHRNGRWLEGADWIAWNSFLNDVLDDLNTEAAIFSYNREAEKNRFYIRRDRRRRTRYTYVSRATYGLIVYGWAADDPEEDFADHCGKTHPETEFPEGTPGYAEWRLAETCEFCVNECPTHTLLGKRICHACPKLTCHECGRYPCGLHGAEDLCWNCFRKVKKLKRTLVAT